MSVALVIDWRGVISLRGLINWYLIHGKKRFWLIIFWIFLFPLFFCVYLTRVAMHQFGSPALPAPNSAPRRVKGGLVVGSLVLCMGLISAFASAASTATIPQTAASAQTNGSSTSIIQKDPAQQPAIISTDTPVPTDTSAPTPTPKSEPTPTSKPHCQAVNNNPWCYNFTPGNLIYTPSPDFCSYFACISSFWNGAGYVIECQDDMYSKSGGRSGSCSHHGGNLRPLYSH